MILFYSPGACSLAEVVLLQWLEAPHRLCRVTRDERKGPIFRRAVNEHGQVPVLLHGGRVLTENSAILLLLADRHGDRGLVPAPSTPERYDVYRWLSWLDSGFHAAHAPLFAPQRFAPDDATVDAVRTHALLGIQDQLGVLERHLDGREHVLLDHRSLLDAYVFAMARWCEEKLDYASAFPNVKRFLDRMREDPGVRAGLAIESGELVQGGPLQGHVAFEELLDAQGRLRPDVLG